MLPPPIRAGTGVSGLPEAGEAGIAAATAAVAALAGDPEVMRRYPAPSPALEGIVVRLDVPPRKAA